MTLTVSLEPPCRDGVIDLLRQADAYSASLYPIKDRQPLGVEALSAPGVRFLVGRLKGKVVGCCALIEQGDGSGELKRMIVDEKARRQGIGRALLLAAEAAALQARLHLIQMEVGARSTGAKELYRRAGYRERGPFGTHRPSLHSIFLEKAVRSEEN